MMLQLSKPPVRPPVSVNDIQRALAKAETPADILQIEAKLDAVEQYMRDTGLYDIEEVRPVNETRMWARWKLGHALIKMERGHGPGRGKKKDTRYPSFKAMIGELKLNPKTATEAQRIAALPKDELEKALARAKKESELTFFSVLIDLARPYWYHASRKAKHKKIASDVQQSKAPLGPFPLIYADPPWKWGHFGSEQENEKGKARTPDQHYPTMTYDEIKEFCIGDKLVSEIANKKAALFLWCTSANMKLALEVMEAWGFEYKTHAVWVKDRSGTGLVFRNQHEVLLYGTRGAMPGPQHQPKSVFSYPRTKHSAKPPEIRKAIEKMYPAFSNKQRIELFARGDVSGWTTYGFEANATPKETTEPQAA